MDLKKLVAIIMKRHDEMVDIVEIIEGQIYAVEDYICETAYKARKEGDIELVQELEKLRKHKKKIQEAIMEYLVACENTITFITEERLNERRGIRWLLKRSMIGY
jgi:Mg2+ and Co2+ transporter CorA